MPPSITTRLTLPLALALPIACASGSSTSEPPPMTTPPTTSTAAKPSPPGANGASPLGPFATLHGGAGVELAPGGHGAPIVALDASMATWWADAAAAPTTVVLEGAGNGGDGVVTGSRWVAGGTQLRVGLGTLDLAAKTYTVDAGLSALAGTLPVLGIAWFPDATRVAILLGAPRVKFNSRVKPENDQSKRQLVIASIGGGGGGSAAVVRKPIVVPGTALLAVSDDSVLVIGLKSYLFDATGAQLVGPDKLPDYGSRASFGAGGFTVVGADGNILRLDPHTGATTASWAAPGTIDAIATPHAIVALDLHGTVRVGCVTGNAVKQIAESSTGALARSVQVVGERLAVVASGPEPIRVATFTNACP